MAEGLGTGNLTDHSTPQSGSIWRFPPSSREDLDCSVSQVVYGSEYRGTKQRWAVCPELYSPCSLGQSEQSSMNTGRALQP